MPENGPNKSDSLGGPILVGVSAVLTFIGTVVFVGVRSLLSHAGEPTPGGIEIVIGLLAVACYFPAAAFFGLGIIRWATKFQHSETSRRQERIEAALQTISGNLSQSESARQIMFRESDRRAIGQAIEREIENGNFEGALGQIDRMEEVFGSETDAEEFRAQVRSARTEQREQEVDRDLVGFEEILAQHEWDRAAEEAARIERRFPDSQRVKGLIARASQTREQYKQQLERQFLEAAQRDDVENAMPLLKELDKYLKEKEAEPYREAARGVLMKKRENLAVQFKLAVHDREWSEAVRIGEEITGEFAHSKMAEEVRDMIDTLRERAEAIEQSRA